MTITANMTCLFPPFPIKPSTILFQLLFIYSIMFNFLMLDHTLLPNILIVTHITFIFISFMPCLFVHRQAHFLCCFIFTYITQVFLTHVYRLLVGSKVIFSLCLVNTNGALVFNSFMNSLVVCGQVMFRSCLIFTKSALVFPALMNRLLMGFETFLLNSELH